MTQARNTHRSILTAIFSKAAIAAFIAASILVAVAACPNASAVSSIEDSAVGLTPGNHASGTFTTGGQVDSYRIELFFSGILTVGVNAVNSLTEVNVSILTSSLQPVSGAPAASWRLPMSATLYLDTGTYYVTVASKGSGATQVGEYVIAAEFSKAYRVSALTADSSHGAASSVPYAAADATVEITATPANGYVFDRWEVTSRKEIEVSMPGETAFTRVECDANIADKYSARTSFTFPELTQLSTPGDVIVTAKFKAAHAVTITQASGGTAYVSKSSAAVGDSVTLTAAPTAGYAFDHWVVTQGGAVVANPYAAATSFTMPDNSVTITPYYRKQIQITASVVAGGVLRADRYTAYSGDSVQIYATPESGYTFERWNVTGGVVYDPYAESTHVTVGESPITLSASFKKKDPATTYYSVIVTANSSAYGKVTTSNSSALKDTTVTISATPLQGSVFEQWTVLSGGVTLASTTSPTTTFKVLESDIRIQATFKRDGYAIILSPSNTAMGAVLSDAETARQGEKVQIRALPKIGYRFSSWSIVSGSATIANSAAIETTLTIGQSDVSVQAVFRQVSGVTDSAWHDYASILNSVAAFDSGADLAIRLSGAAGGTLAASALPVVIVEDVGAGYFYSGGARYISSASGSQTPQNVATEYNKAADLSFAATPGGTARAVVYIHRNATTTNISAVNSSLVDALLLFKTVVVPDVAQSASDWAASDINNANALGIVPPELLTAYQSNITREEYCRIVTRVLMTARGFYNDLDGFIRAHSINTANRFDDTSDVYVTAAYSLGVVNGVGGNKFSPASSITRQEAAVMAQRAADILGIKASGASTTYADTKDIADWAAEGVKFASASGIMVGTGSNMFSPLGVYTREQAIVTLLRLYSAVS